MSDTFYSTYLPVSLFAVIIVASIFGIGRVLFTRHTTRRLAKEEAIRLHAREEAARRQAAREALKQARVDREQAAFKESLRLKNLPKTTLRVVGHTADLALSSAINRLFPLPSPPVKRRKATTKKSSYASSHSTASAASMTNATVTAATISSM